MSRSVRERNVIYRNLNNRFTRVEITQKIKKKDPKKLAKNRYGQTFPIIVFFFGLLLTDDEFRLFNNDTYVTLPTITFQGKAVGQYVLRFYI